MDSISPLCLPVWLLLKPIYAWQTVARENWESEALAESVHTLLAQLGSWSLHALARFGSFGSQGNMKQGWEESRQQPKLWGEAPGWEELQQPGTGSQVP